MCGEIRLKTETECTKILNNIIHTRWTEWRILLVNLNGNNNNLIVLIIFGLRIEDGKNKSVMAISWKYFCCYYNLLTHYVHDHGEIDIVLSLMLHRTQHVQSKLYLFKCSPYTVRMRGRISDKNLELADFDICLPITGKRIQKSIQRGRNRNRSETKNRNSNSTILWWWLVLKRIRVITNCTCLTCHRVMWLTKEVFVH